MKIFIADGKSQLKIRGEINNDQLQAIIKTKFSDSKFDIKGNIPISWRNEKIN